MSLHASIHEGIQEALKKGDRVKADTLRFLFSSLVNREKEKRYKVSKEHPNVTEEELMKMSELQDYEVLDVVVSEVKKHKESIAAFQKGNREDLVKKEQQELKILEGYLPAPMAADEFQKLVQDTILKTGASGIKDMGKVMAVVMPQVKGRVDGSLVSKIVQELLTR